MQSKALNPNITFPFGPFLLITCLAFPMPFVSLWIRSIPENFSFAAGFVVVTVYHLAASQSDTRKLVTYVQSHYPALYEQSPSTASTPLLNFSPNAKRDYGNYTFNKAMGVVNSGQISADQVVERYVSQSKKKLILLLISLGCLFLTNILLHLLRWVH